MSTIISRVFYVLWLTSLFVNLNNGDENNPSQFDDGKYRLPDTIIPTSYELKIVPNLKDAFDFSGEVTITVKAAETTNEVVLHCYGLNLTAISISNETEKINQDKREYLEEEQFLKLKTKSELLKNAEYTIHALFRGSLKDEPIGFYKECYKQGKDIKWLATTQLEPIHARTVFPCFDEPRYKTPFLIHIARSESQMSVANMPYVMSKGPEVKIQNRTWDIFESKQSISTYQVAFTVTEYFFKPDVDIGVVLGTPNNRGNKNIFDILTKSKVILKELESYTKRNFTKENMHMVAISDFLVGALENSGLSTIKESMAIHSRSKTSKLSKEVTELAAVHEFAHQWFGDYVTPAWWNHTWLKEAFATFMEYKILNKIEPKWKMEELFITDILQQALLQDKHSHPMTMQVRTPSEITGIYDFVTYQKGASILKMLEFMISPSIFKRGVQRYLKIGSNKTVVTPDDLWDAMNEQVIKDRLKLPKTIKDIMEPWTLNAGYPLITVEIENEDVIIKQESYDKNAGHNVTWTVPITYGTQSDDLEITTPMEWLNPFEQLVLDNAVKPGQWLILNLGQSGYYRVNYDYNNWQALTEQLNKDFKAIPPVNRAKLIDDALNLAMDQRLNYNTALSLLGYFPKENDYLPQISVLYNLKNLFLKFEQTTIESSLKIFISKLIIKLYNRLGMSNGFFDNDITKRIRKDAVYLACKVDITKCQQSASSLFSKNEKHLEKIDENLKPAVFCSAFDQLDEEIVFRFILEFYNKSNSALDREIVINSFACLKNTSLIKNILAKNVTILRKRDLQKAIEIILRSGKNPLAITEYIRSVLSAINGNIIPKNTENELRYIIRNIKIVNVGQLKALNNLLHQVKELERFHSILNELVERSQNSNVFIRDTERAAREVNETIYEMFSSENKSRRFEFLMQPLKFMSNQFKNALQKGENIFAKLRNSKNYIEPYFTIKIKNLFNYMSNIFHSSPKTIESSTSTVTTKESNVGVSGITNEI